MAHTGPVGRNILSKEQRQQEIDEGKVLQSQGAFAQHGSFASWAKGKHTPISTLGRHIKPSAGAKPTKVGAGASTTIPKEGEQILAAYVSWLRGGGALMRAAAATPPLPLYIAWRTPCRVCSSQSLYLRTVSCHSAGPHTQRLGCHAHRG